MSPEERFAHLVRSPDDEVSLLEMTALIGCAFEPAHDPAEVGTALDQLARGCAWSFEGVMEGLFGRGRLAGNRVDYGDPRNSYLHRVVERGLGLPITLSVIAVEVGRRVGVEIHGVGLPGHFVVASGGRYADPFTGGRIIPADELVPAWRAITGSRGPLDPRLLAPLPPRAVALRMLNNLRATFTTRGDEHGLGILARLRGAYPELASEADEHDRWLRIWN